MIVYGFIALTALLALGAVLRKERNRAAAFAIVAAGLGLTVLTRDAAEGVVAFAIWTIVSYLLRNFPAATVLYLFSAMCYILELQGQYTYAIQVASNLAGLVGLGALWFETPRWRYSGYGGLSARGFLSVAFHAARGGSGAPVTMEKEAD